MAKKMLIDATHPEETRVVVVDGTKVEDFDFESASKRQLAGNIYLAKGHARGAVAPGGLRRLWRQPARLPGLRRDPPGLLPDPVADRQALLAEERALAESSREEDDAEGEGGEEGGDRAERRGDRRRRTRVRGGRDRERALSRDGDAVATRDAAADPAGMETIDLGDEEGGEADEGLSPMATTSDTPVEAPAVEEAAEEESSEDGVEVVEKDDTIEVVAEEEDHLQMRPERKPSRARRYKIQEVDQGPADHAGPGRQGGARQQGRAPHDLPVASPAATAC
jgi:ribonuclease E